MKNLVLVFTLISISFTASFSQSVLDNLVDGAYKKETVKHREPTPYPALREADVMWSRKIWREIDLRQKINHPFYYPAVAPGQEEVYDVPVQTVEGEDIGNLPALNINEATEVTVNRSLVVEGGPDKKVISEFGGPVIVNNKLTSTSEKGIEAQSYYVQGDQTVSRKHTLVGTDPTLAGNPGDVSFYSDPGDGEHVGWIYTKENAWRRFGNVSLNIDSDNYTFDQIGIGTTSPGVFPFQVGAGGSIFHADGIGNVGIATTVVGQYKLYVVGSTNIVGTCTATYFSGDGSNLTNINVHAIFLK